MTLLQLRPLFLPIVLIAILTLLSGLSDARGAIHASAIWQGGRLVWAELGKSTFFFLLGISFYWATLRFMQMVGMVATELQVLTWFGSMLIGVALLSGAFFRWRLPEQIVGIGVLVAIVWLSVRTGQ